MEYNNFLPNKGKNLSIIIDNKKYERIPIKTHVIKNTDNVLEVVEQYASPYLKEKDLVFISEKIIAIMQGRAFPIKDIHPSKIAKFLVKFVHKSPYGIGLGSPWTMELAIKEAGIGRILLAAFCSAITKPFGFRGVFYKVVGKNINAIDGPCAYTLPPYNEYAKLGPLYPDKVTRDLKSKIKNDCIIIDANDLGVEILGSSNKDIPISFLKKLFSDNPLGQSTEQTPICIVREVF